MDRLWPRGVSKGDAAIDLWMKDIAPSPALRVWYGHDPEKWAEFSNRYTAELWTNPAVEELLIHVRNGKVTLVYAARDETHSHALVLLQYLMSST